MVFSSNRMPRFRTKGKLERDAVADFWKNTVAQIPTLTGRLVYLSSLRDPNSGTYRHHGMAAVFGRQESVRALRESHERVFREWLLLPLSSKDNDLRSYLSSLDEPPNEIVSHWIRSGRGRPWIPATARPAEIELFCTDLEALLRTLKGGLVNEPSGPGSSRPG